MWRKLPPVIVDGVVEKGGMFAHQLRWWESPSYIKALVGGYGSGKTAVSAKWGISMCLHNAPAPHMHIAPSYKVAKRTIIPHLKNLLNGRGIDYSHNKTDNEIVIRHKGREGIIWIGSGDDPDALKGPNLGSANIDEPFIQKFEVFQQILARLRDPRAKLIQLGLTGTPEELNWGYDVCEGEDADKYDIEVIHASSADNLALPEQFINSLRNGYDENSIAAYMEGKFVILSDGLVYRQFSRENVIDCDTPESGIVLVGMDFNVDPMSAVLCQEVSGELHQFDEIILPNSDTPSLCKEIVKRYPRHRFVVYPDSSGKSRSSKGYTDFALIRENLGDKLESIEHPQANPALRDRFNSVNGMMCNSNGVRRYFIHPRCKETIADYERTTHPYEEFKRKNAKRTHASDAAGYLIHRRYPAYGKPTLKVF